MAISQHNYLYCFIRCPEQRDFEVKGIRGGNGVYVVPYRDIAAVVSDLGPSEELELNRENATGHDKVIESVMKEFTVLPCSFGCVVKSVDHIREKVLKENISEKYVMKDNIV